MSRDVPEARARRGVGARLGAGALELATHAGLVGLAALLLVAACRPIYTDDLWWHLALGEAFAASGPRLAADPLLFTAPAPPAPAAWLFDVGGFELLGRTGFDGLRAAHAAIVVAILSLVWLLLRRAAGSRTLASLGTGAFVALAAYRLFQLRPGLLTILASLLLYALLIENRAAPSVGRMLAAALLCALWSNVHAAFPLGPLLIASASAGAALAVPLADPVDREAHRTRAVRLAIAAALALVASLANPMGSDAYRAYLASGAETPDLALVSDEWARLGLFARPTPGSPPTPLTWLLVWILLVATCTATFRDALASSVRRSAPRGRRLDPALAGMAFAGFAAMEIAVRFVWLGILSLLCLAGRRGAHRSDAPGRALLVAGSSALLLVSFVAGGDWTLIGRGIPWNRSGYAESYAARKYHARAVWFLRDAGVSGNVFNDYFLGGFLGFWLAPEVRTFVNGSLNVPATLMRDYRALQRRRGDGTRDFLELLDHYRIDVFPGIGLPIQPNPAQPWRYTTTYLEDAAGWIPIYRDPRNAVYLRANERNRDNLARIASYYARRGIPFHPDRGFEVERVLRGAPDWAAANGIVPRAFPELAMARFAIEPARALLASDRLASIYASLGLYADALELDGRILDREPRHAVARRRAVWSLLHLGRGAEALEHARQLETSADSDALAAQLARAAREYAGLEDPRERDALVARLTFLTREEGAQMMSGFARPEIRPPPD